MVGKKIVCAVCRKAINDGGMKCPVTRENFHNKCIAKHIKDKKCKAPHMKIRGILHKGAKSAVVENDV